nr:hypothetical protein [uncultured Desulfobacter sp.]
MTSPPKIPYPHDRRQNNHNRRSNKDRRCGAERRHDFRNSSSKQRRSFFEWLRSITNARLGVDRRKQERRKNGDRRRQDLTNLLTEEEINELLNW